MRIYEIVSTKPLTPEQARLKALKDQAKQARAALKAERSPQKIGVAQKQLAGISYTLPKLRPVFFINIFIN